MAGNSYSLASRVDIRKDIKYYPATLVEVWLGGRVVRTLDLRSIGHEFESQPLRYRVQPWASC